MIGYFSKSAQQKQTLASFDFQWRCLPEGDAMLSDPWFDEHLCEILEEITGVRPEWFPGKQVLDAGCGSGRWSVGLLRLGAEVTAVDLSDAGLARTRSACQGLGRLETIRADLLDLPPDLSARRFDMVYSFGVLHFTGETFKALRNIAGLVAEDGLIVLYLHGSASWDWRAKLRTNWMRLRLAGLTFEEKIEALRKRYPGQDPHQCFNLLSPTLNDRVSFDQTRRALEQLGFVNIAQTVRSGEVFVRAYRAGFRQFHCLRPVPAPHSRLLAHYEEVNRTRRDKGYERTYWEMAGRVLSENGALLNGGPACERFGLDAGALAGTSLLVACPDSLAPALDLIDAGADVTCLSPSQAWIGRASGLPVRVASLLDAPEEGAAKYDYVLALGSSVSLTRRPGLAIERLAGRLNPGGRLVIETLLPEEETPAHKLRRLLLKPFSFERKIEALLRQYSGQGLAGAFSLLSPRLPIRHTELALVSLCEQAGLKVSSSLAVGNTLILHARASTSQAPERPAQGDRSCEAR